MLGRGWLAVFPARLLHLWARPHCHRLPGPALRRPPAWHPTPLDARLSLLEWLVAPGRLAADQMRGADVHMAYVPSWVLERVKASALARSGGMRLSTNDAVQGLMHALVADVRGLPLVPGPGQYTCAMMGAQHGAGEAGQLGRRPERGVQLAAGPARGGLAPTPPAPRPRPPQTCCTRGWG